MADRTNTKKGPSVLLLLAGIASMVVAVSALLHRNPLTAFGDLNIGWILVVVAVVIGLGLVAAPMLGRRTRS